MLDGAPKRNIVIIGGGIIGCTSAYFLTRHPKFNPALHTITLLEASKIAGGASGKAGGLLALWAYPSCIVPLSYRLHAELAKEHDGATRWGYRGLHCGQLNAKGRDLPSKAAPKGDSVSLQKKSPKGRAVTLPKDLDWVDAEAAWQYESMGDPSTTAQVHPYQFTTSMAALAKEAGAKIILGSVTDIQKDANGVQAVEYTNKETSETKVLPATDVVIAAGPWTQSVYPKAPISALRAHSVTIRPTRDVSPYAIFTSITLPASLRTGSRTQQAKTASPEIYARPGQEIYACGEGDQLVPLPALSADVAVDDARCQDIADHVASISDELRHGEVTARQACYLPNVDGAVAGPLVGPTPVKGLFMAAGHTCWGIQNGPGTGKLVSEFVFDGKATSANVKSLDPRVVLL